MGAKAAQAPFECLVFSLVVVGHHQSPLLLLRVSMAAYKTSMGPKSIQKVSKFDTLIGNSPRILSIKVVLMHVAFEPYAQFSKIRYHSSIPGKFLMMLISAKLDFSPY